MSGDVKYINGNPFAFNAVQLHIYTASNDGGRWYGWSGIDLGGEKRERELIYGALKSAAPIAISEGKYTPPSPKITFIASALDADATAPYDGLIEMLARNSPDGVSYGDTQLYMRLSVSAHVRARYEYFNVFLTEPGGSWEEGPSGLKREVGFMCTRFAINGRTLFNSSEER